jgi:hyperosmotically inducible protein
MKIDKTTVAVVAAAALAVAACSDERRTEMGDVAANRVAANDADNTARNARDRDGGTVTPLDQSNSATDVELTQKIRQGITNNDAMSVQARNVKVVSQSGAVTLRGPVESQAEKDAIESVARSAGAARVDNQIEIDRDQPGAQE